MAPSVETLPLSVERPAAAPSRGRLLGRVVAEFLVITAGVLAALAADEWRQSRTERSLGERYMAELARDLEADTTDWRFVQSYVELKVDALDRASAWVRSPDYTAEGVRAFVDDLLAGARAAYDPGTGAHRTTFDELVSTGRLHLVPAEVRRPVLEYYEAVALEQARVIARETPYAPLIYALIPQDPEFTLRPDQTPADLARIARRAQAGDLEGLLVAERNRGRLRREVAARLHRRASELLERVEGG